MLQLQHMKRIVEACYPESLDEARALWHDIKPVKFGESQTWIASGFLALATYQVPEDAAYMIILRTECYVTTFDETAPGFGQFSPPPSGTASWQYTDITAGINQYRITPSQAMHILCDSDEMLFAKGDHLVQLIISTTPPDAVTRFIRTLVYGYLCGATIAGRIGAGESTYFSITDE
jgi:hypothetical protein